MQSVLLFLAQASSSTPADDFGWLKLLVTSVGVPGAMAIVLVWCIHKGYLRTGREVQREQDLMKEVVTEKNMWRDLAMRQAHVVDRQAATTGQAVAAATQQIPALVAPQQGGGQ